MLSPDKILNVLRKDCGYRDGDSIVAGISGGADSVAMLHLLHHAGVPVAAAHVNYGLRGEESDGDEAFVSELCAKLGVPLYTRRTNREALFELNNNIQHAARVVRINFLVEISKKESMTLRALAHNANDQIETVLISFMRGSGFSGMDGMYKRTRAFIRPLLDFRREEILEYLRAVQLSWREDSSNASDDYLRNRIRHHVIPALESVDERNGKGMIRSIERQNSNKFLLLNLAKPLLEVIISDISNGIRIDKIALLNSPSPRLLLNYILHRYGADIHFTETTFTELTEQQTGKRYVSGNLELFIDRDAFVLQGVNNLVFSEFILEPSASQCGWTTEVINAPDPKQFSGFEAVIDWSIARELTVRTWIEGETIKPVGFAGTKKISDVLNEIKVPANEKTHYPVLVHDCEVVWIPGYRVAEKYKVTDTSKPALHIKWQR